MSEDSGVGCVDQSVRRMALGGMESQFPTNPPMANINESSPKRAYESNDLETEARLTVLQPGRVTGD